MNRRGEMWLYLLIALIVCLALFLLYAVVWHRQGGLLSGFVEGLFGLVG